VVESGEERGAPRPTERGLEQFEVVQGGRVEDQRILLLVEADAVEVGERAALRLAHVVENGAGRPDGERVLFQPIAS
jgi:hypothetical protein